MELLPQSPVISQGKPRRLSRLCTPVLGAEGPSETSGLPGSAGASPRPAEGLQGLQGA